jgi:hypothetical protein
LDPTQNITNNGPARLAWFGTTTKHPVMVELLDRLVFTFELQPRIDERLKFFSITTIILSTSEVRRRNRTPVETAAEGRDMS